MKAYHALIAGYDNENIKRIQESCNVKISVPPPSSDKNEVRVYGEKVGVATAVKALSTIYEQMVLLL